MAQRLLGKTAFITAAGQGIGRAIAEAFVREGAKVVATDINPVLLGALAEAIGCRTLVLDVTDGAALSAAAAQAGPVNVLVNAAGFVHAGTVLDCTGRWQHQGRAQPLCLRRHQGGGDRADQGGGR
jgi:2-keto-3-deoxy-L-fuconate dehydrogenase